MNRTLAFFSVIFLLFSLDLQAQLPPPQQQKKINSLEIKCNSKSITISDTSNNKNNITSKINLIPIFAAIIAMLTSIYLAFINSKLTKKQTIYNKLSDKILDINQKIYNLTEKVLLENNSENEKYKNEIQLKKIRSEIHAIIDSTDDIDSLINNIEEFITNSKNYNNRNDLFYAVDKVSSLLTGFIKK